MVTLRTGQPCPDSIVALWKDLDAPRLELQHLSEVETGKLLESVLDGEIAPKLSAGRSRRATGTSSTCESS